MRNNLNININRGKRVYMNYIQSQLYIYYYGFNNKVISQENNLNFIFYVIHFNNYIRNYNHTIRLL